MKSKSIYSISFYSDSLTDVKYSHVETKSDLINKFKNELSKSICDNPKLILDHSEFDFVKEQNTQIEGLVGKEIQPALFDVYAKYKNKIDQGFTHIKFKVQKSIECVKYKKKTKKHVKGDTKEFKIELIENDLTKAATFCARYYNPGLIEYVIDKLKNPDDIKSKSQLKLYESVIHYLDKFGQKFLDVVELKRKNVLNRVFGNPIHFVSKTYESINNIDKIIAVNQNNPNSKITHFITLTGFRGFTDSGKLDIPVKYNEKYHGNIDDLIKHKPSYTVQFVKNKLRIILTKKGDRDYKDNYNNLLGADVNLKHNLFSLSNGKSIDFDRELISNCVKTMLKFDKKRDLLYKTPDNELTEKQRKQKDKILNRKVKWSRRLKYDNDYRASLLIKEAKSNNLNHIIMEDLDLKDKSYLLSKEFYDIKYSRLVKILHLNNLKNILYTQCSNKGLQFTIVPSHYTSQRCHHCGFVHPDNRKNQEEFKCLRCGHEDNADHNASLNIRDIVMIDVLSNALLKRDKLTNWLIPKSNNKEYIRKVYEDYFINSCETSETGVGVDEHNFVEIYNYDISNH